MARANFTINLKGGDNQTANGDLAFQFLDADNGNAVIATANYASVGSNNNNGTDGANITYTLDNLANAGDGQIILEGVDVGASTNIKVQCKDENGNESGLSVAYNLSGSSVQPPTVLADAGGEANTDTEINLTWVKSTTGAMTAYRAYIGGVLQQTFGDVALGTLTGLTAATDYNNITIRAWDGANESADSNSINVTTEVASSYPTLVHQSDYSVDEQSWVGTNIGLAGNTDAIFGKDNVLKLWANGIGSLAHSMSAGAGTIVEGSVAQEITLTYYMPSTNSLADGFYIETGGVNILDLSDIVTPVFDAWTTVVFTIDNTTSASIGLKLTKGANNNFYTSTDDDTDDFMYISEIVVRK